MIQLSGRKIAMIIPHKDFRDPELLVPKKILEGYGAKVMICSNSCDPAIGADGTEVKVDVLIDNLKVANYDAVVFVGGPGSSYYFDNKKAHQIAKETVSVFKVIASICAAGATLANSGILAGKRATSFSGVSNILKEKGAIYTGEPVTVEENIITANGPAAASAFGEAIAKSLLV